MQKITPFLWFDNNAEEAMNFYVTIFKNASIVSANHLPGGGMLGGTFKIDNQEFHVLNGGPHFKFNEAISLFIRCETQAEIDELWEKLSEGGEKSRCGWLKDKFGLSWQVVPPILGQLLSDRDPVKSKRVMEAMMKMNKIIIQDLQDAYDGK